MTHLDPREIMIRSTLGAALLAVCFALSGCEPKPSGGPVSAKRPTKKNWVVTLWADGWVGSPYAFETYEDAHEFASRMIREGETNRKHEDYDIAVITPASRHVWKTYYDNFDRVENVGIGFPDLEPDVKHECYTTIRRPSWGE